MDEFLSILAVIVFVLGLIPSSQKKKKKRKGATSVYEKLKDAQAWEERAFSDEQREKKHRQEAAARRADSPPQGADPCHADMLRPERPAMQVRSIHLSEFDDAGEGQDPCHIGGELDGDASPVYHSPIYTDAQREELGRQVLAGVIMSEVLTRPCARRRR